MMNREYLKYDAKLKIEPLKPHVYYVTFAFVAVCLVLSVVSGELNKMLFVWQDAAYDYFSRFGKVLVFGRREYIASIFITVIEVLSVFVQIGYNSFALRISRGRNVGIYNLGDGFAIAGRVFLLLVVEYVFIFLWSLLFIVPGFIAAYRYRLAFYILLDDPQKSPLQCISESKALMTGHKFELFKLDLSFIGWMLLIALTFGILGIWKLPYIEVTLASYYNTLAFPDGTYPPDRELEEETE